MRIKSNTRKKLLKLARAMVFCCLLTAAIKTSISILMYKDGTYWNRYYKTPDNMIDVMIFGNSHAQCTIDTSVLWDEYGVASFVLASPGQDINNTYYTIKEAVKSQIPQAILVELYSLAWEQNVGSGQNDFYRNAVGMSLSKEYLEYTEYIVNSSGLDESWRNWALWKLPLLHTRYKELKEEDFNDSIYYMRGYNGSFEMTGYDTPAACNVTALENVDEQRLCYVDKIIELCEEKEIDLYFFMSPYVISDLEQARFNTAVQYAEAKGIPIINFNRDYKAIGFDYGTDMREYTHVNNYGAKKVTEYIGQWMKDNSDIPDKREDIRYELWNLDSILLADKRIADEFMKCIEINEYLLRLKDLNDNYICVISLDGNYNALGEVYLERLNELGISKETYDLGGVIIKEGEKTSYYFEHGKEWREKINIDRFELYLIAEKLKNEDGTMYNKKLVHKFEDYKQVDNGINILIYNKRTDRVVDTAYVDVYEGLNIIR